MLLWSTALIGLPLGLLAMSWLIMLPDVDVLARTNPISTARHAVVAAEDASFFSHEGFDWEGIKEAAKYNLEAGELKRGGSTITQQLAKNLYLSSERSLFRKAREALI
ncbi:MAG: biosynthetic peptidoglycan transglycosylase, partial [Nitrospira sp.]